jgi:23S rRNA (uracil1939-C5)-methyltransferase
MTLKRGQEIELAIDTVAFGGRGMARVDGMAVFVDGAVPGDRVLARISRKKKNFAEARVLSLLTASPDRVQAPCPYSGYCGGCTWQFLDYGKQLEYKRQHVLESIDHIGGIREVAVHEAIASENVFGYRNKMEFSCSDRRWLMPDEMGNPTIDTDFALGLHVPGTFNKVLDNELCLLQPELGNRLLARVRDYIKASGVNVYGLKSHVGFWRFVMLRHSVAHDQWMVNLVTADNRPEIVAPLADSLRREFPQIVSVVNNISARKAAIAVGQTEHTLYGSRVLTDAIGSFSFEISANSFFQTNTRAAGRLYDTVAAYAGLTGSETVLDLYSGTGTIAISLSAMARSVLGIEIAESAVADAKNNCRINQVDNCRFVLGDIRTALDAVSHRPDVMIIDPPRVGMHPDVVDRVLELSPRRVIYVSCNPATLARDLALLKDRYRILEVQPVDMFPHTFHIESVARLMRND